VNVKFHYQYRDAGNYKRAGSVVFGGGLPEGATVDGVSEALEQVFEGGCYFIANQVNIPEVFGWDPDVEYDPDNPATYPEGLGPGRYCIQEDLDHCWHEFCGVEFVGETPTDSRSWEEFFTMLGLANKTGWQQFDPVSRRGRKARQALSDAAVKDMQAEVGAPERFQCQVEGCELPHCTRCGHHYDPACTDRSGVCDGCVIEMAGSAAQAQAEAFGGNYEEAARYWGW